MQVILGLIFLAVFVYMGNAMEPSLNTTVATITTPTYSLGVVGLHTLIMPVLGIGSVWLVLKSMQAAW